MSFVSLLKKPFNMVSAKLDERRERNAAVQRQMSIEAQHWFREMAIGGKTFGTVGAIPIGEEHAERIIRDTEQRLFEYGVNVPVRKGRELMVVSDDSNQVAADRFANDM